MLIMYHEDAFIDVDSIDVIVGNYSSKDKSKWTTLVAINGGSLSVDGEIGKNIMDAYIWKNRHAIYDMRPGSPNYRKQKI